MTDGALAAPTSADLTLSAAAQERVLDGVAPNTRRAYRGAVARFDAWCAEHGRTPAPATAETLAEYVNHLGELGRSRATVQQAIAGIREVHRLAGMEPPATDLALKALRSHTREQTKAGRRARQAPPVTIPVLRAMLTTLDLDAPHPQRKTSDLRDHALLVLGFAAFARRSEVAGWMIEDVVAADHGLELHIRQAKTDRTGEGQRADLPRGSHRDTDPMGVLDAWIARLAEHGITTGPLLRTVDRHGRIGGAMSGEAVSEVVRKLARRADVPRADEYTGHSLRAGAATSAFEAGAAFASVCRAGRWVDGSSSVGKYHRSVDRWRDHPLRGVGL